MSRYKNKAARIYLNNLKELSVFRQRSIYLFVQKVRTKFIENHEEHARRHLPKDLPNTLFKATLRTCKRNKKIHKSLRK